MRTSKVSKTNRKVKKSFEFFTLLCTVVGIVIGTGEFIKNDNSDTSHILGATQNAWMAIILWILIGICCIFMILCFIEIASTTKYKGNGTTSNWAKIFISPKIASFISIFWVFFYVPIIYTALSIWIVEFFMKSFNASFIDSKNTMSILTYIFMSAGFMVFFALLNCLTRTPGKIIQIVGTFFKAVPFILILFLGLIFPSSPNAFNDPSLQHWSITNFFLATGPVLFSFDGFIFAANMQEETENKNALNKALIVGIIIIVIVYTLEAISLFLGTATGSVADLFSNIFKSSSVNIILNLLITIAIVVGLNGNTLIGANYITTDSKNKLLYTFNKKISLKSSGVIQLLISLIWYIPLIFLGLFQNNGLHPGTGGKLVFQPWYYADVLSNIVVIFAFLIYMLIIIFAVINRYTKRVVTEKVKYMPFFAYISTAVLLILISYSLYAILAKLDLSSLLLICIIFFNFLIFIINSWLLKKGSNNSDSSSKNKNRKSKKMNKNITLSHYKKTFKKD